MKKKNIGAAARQQGNAGFATVVGESVLPVSRRHSVFWRFCDLCGQSTEYASAVHEFGVFKRATHGAIVAVPQTAAMRAEAKRIEDDLVDEYTDAMAGKLGPYAVAEMRVLCELPEMRGDFSVEAFRVQVARLSSIGVWLRHGDMLRNPRLPSAPSGRQRPSKLYCEGHNPRRSIEARRAYQRDRKFLSEYEKLISSFWTALAGELRPGHLDDHALVRDAAYHGTRVLRARTRVLDEYFSPKDTSKNPEEGSIENYYPRARAAYHVIRKMNPSMGWLDEIRDHGVTNQTETARLLKVSKQAVSAALKGRSHLQTSKQ